MPMKDRLKCYMSLGSLSNQAIKKTLYSASFNLGRRQEKSWKYSVSHLCDKKSMAQEVKWFGEKNYSDTA